MGAQNGIVGNEYGTGIPETEVDKTSLIEEKKAARFSKSAEYKKLKEYMEERIDYYQKYLPDGREIGSIPMPELGQKWVEANTIVREFKLVLQSYEQAAEVVKEAEKQ